MCYSIVYYYNGAQKYEQFLQVSRLYRALILLGLALYLPSASVSLVVMVLYMYSKKNLVTSFLYFLSASLYFSKRGAYSDRLCRDVVGWLSRACTVAKECILGL